MGASVLKSRSLYLPSTDTRTVSPVIVPSTGIIKQPNIYTPFLPKYLSTAAAAYIPGSVKDPSIAGSNIDWYYEKMNIGYLGYGMHGIKNITPYTGQSGLAGGIQAVSTGKYVQTSTLLVFTVTNLSALFTRQMLMRFGGGEGIALTDAGDVIYSQMGLVLASGLTIGNTYAILVIRSSALDLHESYCNGKLVQTSTISSGGAGYVFADFRDTTTIGNLSSGNADGYASSCIFHYYLGFGYPIRGAEAISLTKNPWQVFPSTRRSPVWVPN